MYVCMYVCMCIHMYVYMYFYVVENTTDIIDEIDIGTPIVPDTTNGWVYS